GGYTYTWRSNGVTLAETSANITGLAAGAYSCVIQTGMQSKTLIIAITQTTKLFVTSVQTNTSYYGLNDGEISINATGGKGNYTYLWNTSETTATIGNLKAGIYICTITSGSQSTVVTVEITQPAKPFGTILKPNNNITHSNPGWYIENIENFPNNVVTIYDRYGRKMERIVNYNNEFNNWKGQVNGKTLEQGTYYFVIDLGERKEKVKGFISVFD
ncbi:MAG: gliding motility-associated C-terminal domain-containing protein, partial [Sphingobacteriaceae bacterium]|nr:gliding motility-associated C-terminal domain-containing protein [Sphingobacteriaceae bacterium]